MTTPPGSSDGLDPVAGTARWTAAERARESARPDRLFDDPLAMVLAGQALAEAMRPPPPPTTRRAVVAWSPS